MKVLLLIPLVFGFWFLIKNISFDDGTGEHQRFFKIMGWFFGICVTLLILIKACE